jgi:DNA-binding CsgD family transcriptional regulator
MGDFSLAEQLLADVTGVLERYRTQLSPDANSFAFLGSMELAIQQGRLDDARRHAALAAAGARLGLEVPIASVQAYLGYVSGMPSLLDEALAAVDDEVPAGFAALRHYILAFAAMTANRAADAADHACRGFDGLRGNGVGQGFFVPLVPVTLLACGRVEEARRHLDDWAATVDELGCHPMHVAVFHQCGAIVHLANGDDAMALDHAHGLLDLAHEHGYALFRVDALEAIADAQARRGNGVLAARLLGAARAERDRVGYVGLWRPDPESVAVEHAAIAAADPQAFEEGRGLSVADATELAGRARSERTRATHGWDSLTPTERNVVGLVADGLSNADIAARLLMSVPTVKSHLTHVFTKLSLTNRTELAAAATQRQIESIGSTRWV